MDRKALVIGGGISGLLAAQSLSKYFKDVTLIDRDNFPDEPINRKGAPQGKHFHALLGGGFRVLDSFFPGFGASLEQGGAVKLHATLDMRIERPGLDPFPQRDLGLFTYSLSRPLLEYCIRERVYANPNIKIHQDLAIGKLIHHEGRVIGALSLKGKEFYGDIVVDAASSGVLTLSALKEMGFDTPNEDIVGVDIHYATGIFEIPPHLLTEWKTLMTLPKMPESSRGLLISPLENNKWICGLSGRQDEKPGGDLDGFLEFCASCRTKTGYEVLKQSKLIGDIFQAGLKEARRRYFDRLKAFPAGLVPVGDVICKLNPVYGQGMTIAALEVEAMDNLFSSCDADILANFNAMDNGFFEAIDEIVDSAWQFSVIPDFVYPYTTGTPPQDLREKLMYSRGVVEVAAEDPGVHKLFTEVSYLLKPRSALVEPSLRARVLDKIHRFA